MDHVPIDQAGPHARDVLHPTPRTLAGAATVADARRAFEYEREKLVVVADGARFVTSVTRAELDGAADDAPLASLSGATPTLRPDAPLAEVLETVGPDRSRIPVVGEDGRLHGLVCFNVKHQAFCTNLPA